MKSSNFEESRRQLPWLVKSRMGVDEGARQVSQEYSRIGRVRQVLTNGVLRQEELQLKNKNTTHSIFW